jgi:hypothetical protein
MTSENPENSISPQDPSIHANEETDKHPGGPPPPAHPATTESHPPPTRQQCEITCDTKRDWIDKTTLGFEFVGLVVLIVYTIATVIYACITHRMWNEMQMQSCIQREASINAERAWVGLEGSPQVEATPLREKKFNSTIKIALKNFGKGPAFNVFSGARFATHGHVLDTITSTCNLIFPFVGLKPSSPVYGSEGITNQQWGSVIFPDSPPFIAAHDTTAESASVLGQEVFVVGCIVYKDQFRNPHWTKFSYSTGPFVTQVVRDASSFQHLYTSSANNYTDDAEKKQDCPVTKPR